MRVDETLFKEKIRPLFARATHCAIATVNADGTPHLTPIGSVVLESPERGWFFQKFTQRIPRNAEQCDVATIMAVNDRRLFWLGSLLKGRFAQPPAMRLKVRLGALQDASEAQARRFQKRVALFRGTRGHQLLWSQMSQVRSFEIIEWLPVHIGPMTATQFK